MNRDEKPAVVDLRRYRDARARAEAARRKAPPPERKTGPGGKEPLVGSRKNAGLILALVVLALLALVLGPSLL